MAIDVQSQYFHNCKDLSSVTTENIRTGQVRRLGQDALQDVKKTSELIEAWGTEPEQLTQLPAEQRLELAQKLAGKDKLKKLARMLGRFRLMAIHSQKSTINHGLDEVYDMETGSDLEKVLPTELVRSCAVLTARVQWVGITNSGPKPLPWHYWRSHRCRKGHLP